MNKGLAIFLLLSSCAKKAPALTGAPVGAACAADADCQRGLYCELGVPFGMCTQNCTPCPGLCDGSCKPGCAAAAGQACTAGCIPVSEPLCPNGANCVSGVLPNSAAPELRCLASCDVSTPCRADTPFVCCDLQQFSACIPGTEPCNQ